MGYWSIVVEGTGAHHNPAFEKDANRMADEFVKQLKAAGHDIKRAAFLFDYKGEDAGDTLPYREPKWALSRNEVPLSGDGPYHVHQTIAHEGATPLYEVINGKHRASWHTDSKQAVQLAEHYNEIAAKQKPVSGGSQANDVATEPSWVRTFDDGRTTSYWWRPADGITYRARSEGGDREAFEWEETYDLDLGSDVYLSWTWGTQDGYDDLPFSERPRTEQPIGAHMHWRDSQSPSGISGGGVIFSSAPERYRVYTDSVSKERREQVTWDVQSWAPLTITPSVLAHGHNVAGGRTSDKHGFITAGKWVPA